MSRAVRPAGIVAMFVLLPALAALAGAQSPEKPIELEPVEVKGQREQEAARERRLVPATGTKTETNILDLPVSVGVVDKRQIEQQGAVSVMEALANVSSVYSFNSYNAFPQYAVRGFFGNNVTLMTNGIKEHENQRGSRDVDLFNLERIEVLKGPSSVLYGQGAIGAAVNYVTKHPTTTPSYEGAVSYGSFDTARASVGAGGPLVPGRLLYRVDLGASTSEGFEDRTDYERYQGTVTLTAVLASEARVTLFIDARYDDISPYMGIPLTSRRPLRLANVRRENNYNIPDTDNWVYVLRDRVLYEQPLTEGVKLRNLLYFFRQELGYRASENYTFVAPRTLTRDFLQFTRNDYLLGDQLELLWDTPLGATKHKFLFGLDGGYNRLKSTQSFGTAPSIDLFAPVEPGRGLERITSRNNRDGEARLYAVYGQDQVDRTEQWKAVLGLRFDHANAQITRTNTHQSFQRKFDDFSYRAGIVYQPAPVVSLYANYSTATKPVTNFFAVPTNGIFKPERAQQWEAGVKNTLLGNRFVTTLAYFAIDKENLQVTRNTAQGPITDQIGEQRSRGIELDIDYALTRDWRVTGNYSLTSAYFAEFVQGSRNLSGKRPRLIPEQVGALCTTYDLGLGFGVGTGFRFVGDRFGEDSNVTGIPEYFLWDAMLTYGWKGVEASLNFKNITDTTRFDQALADTGVTTNLVPGRPFEVIGGLRVLF